MPHSPEDKKKALARARRICGQAEALARALEAGADCAPVLQQLAALRGAVNGLMSEVMQSHIREQLSQPATRGRAPDPAQLSEDLTSLVRTYLK